MWWNYVIPIVTLIVGLVGGFFIGVYYLRRQLTNMQNDPEMLQKMAKQMGYNLNGKQMQQAQQMMKKNGGMPGGMPGGKPPKGNAYPPNKRRR